VTPPVREWLWLISGVLIYVLAATVIGMVLAHCAMAAPKLQRGELELLARVVQRESTGEPEAGQRAIAWTVLNRLEEPELYGRTITKVLSRRHQYAAPARLSAASPAYLKALHATVAAVLGEGGDPSNRSTHFHRCAMRHPPAWARRLTPTVKLGAHCFYR
jgi:N-acetylmuramoyl-L-alanine amidase